MLHFDHAGHFDYLCCFLNFPPPFFYLKLVLCVLLGCCSMTYRTNKWANCVPGNGVQAFSAILSHFFPLNTVMLRCKESISSRGSYSRLWYNIYLDCCFVHVVKMLEQGWVLCTHPPETSFCRYCSKSSSLHAVLTAGKWVQTDSTLSEVWSVYRL